ncbi:Ig-like domain-containing protein [Nannocystis sp. RBIL2]|uniref:Ig-like domain-containing protein n=1 Tax=Nannocystis sp. RBIL2 TaxID=2996788 RepID=UPI0022713850|nr:Ig-like domain-containing protein [Nannocystis sp. RBIL2]MCY1071172.1 Ig-like domain-containing protein [Nannocystis sp. RBIL2]
MSRHTFAPLTLLALGACNTEQAYQDLIQNHGQTWDTTAAASTSGAVPTAGETAPTTSASGGSGSDGATAGTEGDTWPTGTSGTQLDLPPELAFSVTPEAVQLATFVELAATCVDDVGIAEVRFFVDGAPLANVAAPPFAAQWPVKSTDEDGPRSLRAECEDLAGHVVVDERTVDVALPQSGTMGWPATHPSENWASEALDASPAPDGSWWVCGYDSDGDGGAAMWLARYSSSGQLLFDKLISRGPGFSGTCSGIESFPDDPHRAALTGAWTKDGLSPTLWVGVVDDRETEFLRAEHKDTLVGEFGNDVAVTPNHQIRVTGYKMMANDDYDIIYHAMTVDGEKHQLAYAGGDLYTSPYDGIKNMDVGEAIVIRPDGTSLIAGRTNSYQGNSRGIIALVGSDHEIVENDVWPFVPSLPDEQHQGFNDLTVTDDGLVATAGWWRQKLELAARPRLLHFQLTDLATEPDAYTQSAVGEAAARSLARMSTGSIMVAAVWGNEVEEDDIWLKKYPATGWESEPDGVWPQTYSGFFHGNDAPHAIRINALDEILVVGFETVQVIKNGNAVSVRQAWLRAFHG